MDPQQFSSLLSRIFWNYVEWNSDSLVLHLVVSMAIVVFSDTM
jgi:hypothetical protein